MLGDAERDAQHHLEDVGHLRGRVDENLAAHGLRHDGDTPRLHRLGDESLLHIPLLHDMRRRREGAGNRVRVRDERPRVRGVRAERVVHDDPVAERVFQIDDRGQRLVVDDDSVHAVARRVARAGNHDRDDVTDIAGLLCRDREVLGVLHVRRHRPRARHRLGPRVAKIGTGQDGFHPRERERAGRVDRSDTRVRVRAAHHPEKARAGDHEVVDITGLARQQARIFLAPH